MSCQKLSQCGKLKTYCDLRNFQKDANKITWLSRACIWLNENNLQYIHCSLLNNSIRPYEIEPAATVREWCTYYYMLRASIALIRRKDFQASNLLNHTLLSRSILFRSLSYQSCNNLDQDSGFCMACITTHAKFKLWIKKYILFLSRSIFNVLGSYAHLQSKRRKMTWCLSFEVRSQK